MPWIQLEQRRIPPELVHRDGLLAYPVPALTSIDLVPELGGEVIDSALRTSAATLDQMWDAWRASPYRKGNSIRKLLLHDSRDHPWSEAERLRATADSRLPERATRRWARRKASLAGRSQRSVPGSAVSALELESAAPV